jgi:hypothetical protein
MVNKPSIGHTLQIRFFYISKQVGKNLFCSSLFKKQVVQKGNNRMPTLLEDEIADDMTEWSILTG